jgi:hypothetical protein
MQQRNVVDEYAAATRNMAVVPAADSIFNS